ncbi:MAG: hypothetical protein SFV51_07940 [Bryobacteraceae bacterium]|nr:hypothetical protein [Bryobacteraceae bacterium]
MKKNHPNPAHRIGAPGLTRRSLFVGALPLAAAPATSFHRGVNFTAEWPDTYSSDRARSILESLPSYGVNAVAFVPYGFTPAGQPSVRFSGTRAWEKDSAIRSLSQAARAKGMKVFLKPQIWVRSGAPTDLDFSADTARRQWFDEYRLYLEHYAALAAAIRADLFSVGVEFSRLSRHEQEWRALIARARRIYPGPLTYSANWGVEFESVRFWDALDVMGVNNYYPLPDDLATSTVASRIEQVQRRFRKPVIFPEAGFASLEAPHRKPWDETVRKLSPEDQARCYEAVFQGFYRKPWLQGIYWWKVGSNGFGGTGDGSHTPWRKPAMQVLSRWYLRGGR